MPRRTRTDEPGIDYHVMYRGVGKRTIFERRSDFRYFLSLLAWLVKDGQLQVHAFCLLSTHFHLLLTSRKGRLPANMQWLQDLFARRFNLGRGRCGPLFQGRYRSRVVDDSAYWLQVVRYIDQNPVQAGLVAFPWQYPYGSALRYCGSAGPPWLERARVEALVCRLAEVQRYEPRHYRRVFGEGPRARGEWLVERRLLRGSDGGAAEDLSRIVAATQDELQGWMQDLARKADGTAAAEILLDPATLEQVLAERQARGEAISAATGSQRASAWPRVRAGLLRTMCGLAYAEIAERMGFSSNLARNRALEHVRDVARERWYATWAASIVRETLVRDYPGGAVFFESNRLRALTRERG